MIARCLAGLIGLGVGFVLLAAIPDPAKQTLAIGELDAVMGEICRPLGPLEVAHAAPTLDPDYVGGMRAIELKNWSAAVRLLSSAALRDTRNADVQNHLGFAYYSSGQLDLALEHYRRALRLNPRHRRAHGHLGVAYLTTNDPAKAEESLAALEQICLIPCEEYDDLRKAIESDRQRSRQ